MKSGALQWSGIAVSPVAWFIQLGTNFALAPLACSGAGKVTITCISGLAFTLALLAGMISLYQWQFRVRDRAPAGGAVALAGVGLSALFSLVIAAQTIPTVMMQGCE